MSHLLQQITETAGRHKRGQRVGRGEGSKGKTSGRGNKGAGSRAGSSQRIGFEGGQTEAYRRFPQRGFSNKPFETRFHVVNLSALDRFDAGSTVDLGVLKQAGLVPNTHQSLKILGNGAIFKKLTIVAGAFSRSAHQAIVAAGGEAQGEDGQPFQFRQPKNRRQANKLDKRLAGLGLPAREQPEAADEASDKKRKKDKAKDTASKKHAVATSGESGSVTEAPESDGTDAVAAPRGKAKKSSKAAAPEGGGEE